MPSGLLLGGAGATEYTDSWAGFLASGKLGGYRVDQDPTSHPIRQAAGDVAEATAGFDAITYEKGASVLKQLVAYVGEDRFVAGLPAYFSKHAWGNASLTDLMRRSGSRRAPASGARTADQLRRMLVARNSPLPSR